MSILDGPNALPTADLLLVTVTGQVCHRMAGMHERLATRLNVTSTGQRVFVHHFTLRADAAATSGYRIVTDTMRFV